MPPDPTSFKIVLVEFSPGGGLFQFTFQLGDALARRGHTVELLTGPDPELTSAHPGLRVCSVLPTWPPGSGSEAALFRKLRRAARAARHVAAWYVALRHIRRTRPDVVQWSEWRFAIDGLAAGLAARRRWSRISVELAHSPVPIEEQRMSGSYYRRGRLLDLGLGTGYRAMDSVLVLGEASRHQLTEIWPEVERCDVIPHGDEQALAGDHPPPAPSDCPPRVLLFGSLTAYKGVDLLLEAWPRVRRQVPGAELLIAGSVGPDLDQAELSARAQELDGVCLRVGYVPLAEVGPLVGSARVLVAPYRRSNASGVVRLGQTLGRPVVVTDVGDLASSVEHGRSGLVTEPDNPTELGDALVRVLSDPELADRMGEAGRQDLQKHASWPVVAEAVEGVYLRALALRGRPA